MKKNKISKKSENTESMLNFNLWKKQWDKAAMLRGSLQRGLAHELHYASSPEDVQIVLNLIVSHLIPAWGEEQDAQKRMNEVEKEGKKHEKNG